MSRYETVFIISPALTSDQAKEVARKFRKVITDLGAKILHEETWGSSGKSTGYYNLIEFEAGSGSVVGELEAAFKKDQRVLRFMTVKLDKLAISKKAGKKRIASKAAAKSRKTSRTSAKKGAA
jgi:small subunit ribosomal protein S6